MTPPLTATPEIEYPQSDGKPMAESTKQYDWIVKLTENLRVLFDDRSDVFVSADQFWYPVKGHPEIVMAPDPYVVFGRPKKDRPSWKQWEENDVPLTVVFEILSPSNTPQEMIEKFHFYDDHGVEEYYVLDPEKNDLEVYLRGKATLVRVNPAHNFRSPRLGIRFDLSGEEMVVYYPNGQRFLTMPQLAELRAQEKQRADDEKRRADQAQKDADDEKRRADRAQKDVADQKQRADDEKRRANRMAELVQKVLAGQANPQELQELQSLSSTRP